MQTEWQKVDKIAAELEQKLGRAPAVYFVLGSGLGGVAEGLTGRAAAPFDTLEGWPRSTVAGHEGVLHRGQLGGVEVAIQQGRVHLYEGYTPAEVVRPLRAAITWGAKTVVLTNAAGGIGTAMHPGALMLVTDHLNLTGRSPLVGQNDDRRGPRFTDLSLVYTQRLRDAAQEAAAICGLELCKGVYAGLLGPTYETPAEVRMLAHLGADAVGMSTVLEAIAARHLGARVLALSSITNRAAGLPGAVLDHREVQLAAGRASTDLTRLLTTLAPQLDEQGAA